VISNDIYIPVKLETENIW